MESGLEGKVGQFGMAHFAGPGLIFALGEHADKDKMWT